MIRRTVESISLVKLVIIFVLVGITVLLGLIVLGIIPLPFGNNERVGDQKVGIFDPKPGSCLVLEQKYCDQLVLKDSATYPGEKIAYAKLPVGTKIFAPSSGDVQAMNKFVLVPKVGGKNKFEWGYNLASDSKSSGNQSSELYNIIFFVNPEKQIAKNVQAGELIGEIEMESLLTVQEYNFAFILSRFNDSAKKYINITQEITNK